MAVAREGKDRWELRLGAAHAVTWIGLALGVTVGAYFIGFFSGRYVGYDTARSATVSEVAKLTIQDDLFDRQGESGSSDIYSRLDGNAVTEASSLGTETKAGGKSTGGSKKGENEEPSSATKFAEAMREDTAQKGNSASAKPEQKNREGAIAAAEIDSLFDESATSPEASVEGNLQGASGESGQKLAVAGVAVSGVEGAGVAAEAEAGVLKSAQKGVRVLGGDDQSEVQGGVQGASSELPAPPTQQDTSLGAILEERVAKARSAQNETLEGKKVQDTTKGSEKAVPSSKESGTTTPAKMAKVDPPAKVEVRKEEPKAPTEAAAGSQTADSSSTQSPSASAGMVKQVLPPGYFAQVAAPKRLQEAQDVARRLKRSGFPVVIETAHVRGEDYYRVLVGPEDGKVQAERLVDQLKRESYLSGTAFLRRVK
jgi:cell division septation protein DedD